MVSELKQWRTSFLLSIVGHLALLAFFYNNIFVRPIGMKHAMIEHVYLFEAKQNKPNESINAQHAIRKQSIPVESAKEKTVRVIHHVNLKTGAKSSVQHAYTPDQDLTPGIKSVLLEQLHDDVAHHLVYPDSAASLDLSGIVTLRFLMLPTGKISQITIVRSSGSSILDDAACATLDSISPFTPAQHYLHEPDYFTIPVAFEIS